MPHPVQSASQIAGVTYTAAIIPKRDRGKRVSPPVSNRSAREIFTNKKIFELRCKKVAHVNAAWVCLDGAKSSGH